MQKQKSKIPKNAKLVFRGIIWDVYQWRQKLFDGSYVIYEAAKRLDTVVIIPTVKKKILIAIEEQPDFPKTLGLIAGKLERGEKPLSAAKRELLEETGFDSKDWELLEIHEGINSMKVEWNIYVYIARNCRKVAEQKLEAGERIETKLIDFNSFMSLPNKQVRIDTSLINYIKDIKRSEKSLKAFKDKFFKS